MRKRVDIIWTRTRKREKGGKEEEKEGPACYFYLFCEKTEEKVAAIMAE